MEHIGESILQHTGSLTIPAKALRRLNLYGRRVVVDVYVDEKYGTIILKPKGEAPSIRSVKPIPIGEVVGP